GRDHLGILGEIKSVHPGEIIGIRRLSLILGIGVALAATSASAQSVDLTGTYQCVQMCRGGKLAYVTQNGPELNLLTEGGEPSAPSRTGSIGQIASGSMPSTSVRSIHLTA
ncbi:hypothetical protein ACVSQB_41320, partial [Bradyrhizobium elkanii]